ncbi:MAG TPA: hypothetical protein VJ739_10545 [Gemmataceae bacterium]|nr:hypothetical protein [Gemmataceae bacterium]
MRLRVFLLLRAASVPVVFLGGSRPGAAAAWVGPWEGLIQACCLLLVPLLFVMAVVLVILLLSLDFTRPRPPSGELEHLLGRKARLFHLACRVRGSWRPAPCQAVKPAPSVHVRPAPLVPPGGALETLVRLKRRGAWAPRSPGGAGEGPANTNIRR